MSKVLSVRQPWASMIVRGLKRFEIRSWSTTYRGQLIIHASSSAPTRAFAEEIFEDRPELAELLARIGLTSLEDLLALPRSAIVGVVTLGEVLDSEAVQGVATVDDAEVIGELLDDQFYWLLSHAIEIAPVTGINGKLNLWELPAAVDKKVNERVSRGSHASFRSDVEGAKIAEWHDASDDEDVSDEGDDEPTNALVPSPELAAVIGAGPYTGEEVAAKIWAYIKKHKLQDDRDKRIIRADDALKKVFGRSKIDVFEMTNKVASHLS